MASTLELYETPAKSFVTEKTISRICGQVVVRISGGKIITRWPRTATLDAGLRDAVEALGERVRHTENRALYPGKLRRPSHHSHYSGEGLPWLGRANNTKMEVEEESDVESEAPSVLGVAHAVVAPDLVADAMAALPRFESLKYPMKGESAGLKARSSSPAFKEGDDDPCQERWSYLPWDQGVWEDAIDGRLVANYDENYQRGRNVIDDVLMLRVVGRPAEAAALTEPSRRSSASTWSERLSSSSNQSITGLRTTARFASRCSRMGGGREPSVASTAKSTSYQAVAAIISARSSRDTAAETLPRPKMARPLRGLRRIAGHERVPPTTGGSSTLVGANGRHGTRGKRHSPGAAAVPSGAAAGWGERWGGRHRRRRTGAGDRWLGVRSA